MNFKKLSALSVSFVLSIASLFVITFPGVAHASGGNTLLWCGANNANFSLDTNWSADNNCGDAGSNTAYPGSDGNSDTLVFNDSNLAPNTIVIATDDISSLTVAAIQFTGGNGTQVGYTIGGSNTIAVTTGITDTSILETTPALGANIFNNTVSVGSSGPAVTFAISTGSATEFVNVTGSNNITVQGGGEAQFATQGSSSSLASYTGTISSSDGSMIQIQNDLSGTFSSSGTIAVSGTSILDMLGGSCKTACTYTYDFPISLGGSGTGKDSALNLDGYQDTNITNVFSGTVTLTTNVAVSETTGIGSTTLEITGPVNFGSFYIKTPVGPNVVSVLVPGGTNDSSVNPNIGQNVTYTDNGTVGTATVESGGILKGSGAMAAAIIQTGGTLAPGDAPSCLTVNGNLTENGTYAPEIQSPGNTACTDYDQTIVTGSSSTINLTGGTLSVDLLNSFSPTVGQSFEIINNQTGSPITGTFNNLSEGDVFSVGTTKFKITYKGGTTANNVLLTVVSPSTPDTGLALTSASVALPLLGSIAAASGIYFISRKIKYTATK